MTTRVWWSTLRVLHVMGMYPFQSYSPPGRLLMRAHRMLTALSSLAVVAAGLTLAPSASADSVQVQSYQRATESQVCTAQPDETPWQAAWGADSSWSPSWELWANGGSGGWVCSRSITWLRDPTTTEPARVYRIGDIGPGGGTVFYDAGSQQPWGRYLEAAPTDVTSGTGMLWSGNVSVELFGTSSAIGTGAANTEMIITQACATPPSTECGNEAGKAATSAAAYSTPTAAAGQWFLPSWDELNAMCQWAFNDWTRAICNDGGSGGGSRVNGGFAGENYWSSSEKDSSTSWFQSFDNGLQINDFKFSSLRVRPIRAF